MAAVDENNTLLGENDPRVGIEILTHIDVDAVCNFSDLRVKVLSPDNACRRAIKNDRRDDPQSNFHNINTS